LFASRNSLSTFSITLLPEFPFSKFGNHVIDAQLWATGLSDKFLGILGVMFLPDDENH
jgi:hypothetical protein